MAAVFTSKQLDEVRGGDSVSDADLEAARFALDIAIERANGLAAVLSQNFQRSREADE